MAPTRHNSATQSRRFFSPARLARVIARHCAGLLLLGLPIMVQAEDETPVNQTANPSSKPSANQLDWVPLEDMTEEQKALVPTACCGAYIAPPRDDDEADLDPDKAKLFGSADQSEAQQQNKITLSNNVHLTQGRRSIRTDKFYLDKSTREAELTGNIQVREPGMLLRADKAYINIDSGDARLDDAQFVIYENRIHGSAESLEKFGDRIISLDDGTFTSCEPGDNTWLVEGSNITIHNDKHYGTAKHMRLKIKDVPVAYAPYFRFPVGPDRLTGFLFPSMGFDSDDGVSEFSAPFYWNIAPNYDATITPRYLANHGYFLGTELRHLSPNFETTFIGSAISNDRDGVSDRLRRQLDDDASDAEAYPYRGKDRWQFNLNQSGGRNQQWNTQIDYTDVSDIDYIRDIDRGAVDLNRQAYIRQMVSADYTLSNWNVGAKVEEFRLLSEQQLPYRELPRAHVDGHYLVGDWLIKLNNEYTHFAVNRYFSDIADNQEKLNHLITGERFRADYGITWDKEYQAVFIKPGVGVKALGYALESPSLTATADTSPSFIAPQGSLDTGLIFERDEMFFGDSFTQTLEPRAFYLYRDYENQDALYGLASDNDYVNFDTSDLVLTYQQLYRDSRFSGGDRIDDTNQLTLGVTTRFIDNESGIERLRLGLGQIIYFEDRNIAIASVDDNVANTQSTSKFAAQVSGQITDHLRIDNDLTYDHHRERIDTASTSFHYMDANYRILNVGYRYARTPITQSPLQSAVVADQLNQVDVTALWPISAQWALIGRSNYDFKYDAELDTFAGLEYTDCCYRISILARQWVDFDLSSDFLSTLNRDDYDRGVFLEIQLKGFGSLNQRISKLLDKAMLGYSEREDSLQ